MKDQDSFNPAMPADFKLLTETIATDPEKQSPGNSAAPIAAAQKRKRKSHRSEKQSAAKSGRPKKKKPKVSWQHLNGKINAKLAGLDREKLKQVLTACGVAGGVVLAVLVAAKLMPVAALLLALLGLAGVIRVWDRLRGLPHPGW
jgi:hypothetical protein